MERGREGEELTHRDYRNTMEYRKNCDCSALAARVFLISCLLTRQGNLPNSCPISPIVNEKCKHSYCEVYNECMIMYNTTVVLSLDDLSVKTYTMPLTFSVKYKSSFKVRLFLSTQLRSGPFFLNLSILSVPTT